ncbi:MAG TPA: copper resistance CopC family protein [Pedococcus sp.]|uniref:copper resistance CopC family protein n=1 Tax=Pedococcus sp. TaxID=2860345 RepID=UPI002F9576F7
MESRGKTRLIRISVWVAVLSLLLAVVSSLATALAASAHTELRSMAPASGSTATTAPTQVVLTFSEPVSTRFAAVTVTDGTGATVTDGRPTVSGATVTQPLRALRDGSYAVTYRVVSEDGHPVSGRASFSVHLERTSATAPATPAPSPSGTSAAATATPGAPSGTPSPIASAPRGVTPQPAVPWALAGVIAAAVIGGIVALGRGRPRRR